MADRGHAATTNLDIFGNAPLPWSWARTASGSTMP